VTLVSARMFSTKMLPFPTVAEEPTCQYTLHPLPPLPPRFTTTLEFGAVVSVVPIWKIHCWRRHRAGLEVQFAHHLRRLDSFHRGRRRTAYVTDYECVGR
jgi:hypothetical protein